MIVTDPLFIAFLTFTLAFVATPGSTTAVVVRNALDGGRRAGLFAALGAACASVAHATLAGLGGAALLRAWPGALDVIRVAGGGYLAYLGVRTGWLALRGETPLAAALTESRALHHRSWREGLMVNLLGPAVLTFYLAGVPTFIRPAWPRGTYALMVACHVSMAFACHSSWALSLHRLRAVFQSPGPRRALGLLTSAALLALAARIALH